MTLRLPHPDSDEWLWLIALAIVCLFIVASCVKADDTPKPRLLIGVHSGSPMWHRVRSEVSRDDWLCETFDVVLEDRDWKDVRYRFSNGDKWTPWPQPKESRVSAFCTSGLAIEWARPELEKYIAGIAQEKFLEHWNLPMCEDTPLPPGPPLPVQKEDDHVAPVPEGDTQKEE